MNKSDITNEKEKSGGVAEISGFKDYSISYLYYSTHKSDMDHARLIKYLQPKYQSHRGTVEFPVPASPLAGREISPPILSTT